MSKIRKSALNLLEKLKAKSLNIITVESATGGKIISSLIDIPFYGDCVYGSIVSYSEDAKRHIVDVSVNDIYTKRAAKEMAIGALNNSKALTSLSITGYAVPIPVEKLDKLAVADITFAIRKDNNEHNIKCKTIDLNDTGSDNLKNLCEKYKNELLSDKQLDKEFIELVRNQIRDEMTLCCLEFASESLSAL